jgi:hypothetical protein
VLGYAYDLGGVDQGTVADVPETAHVVVD